MGRSDGEEAVTGSNPWRWRRIAAELAPGPVISAAAFIAIVLGIIREAG